MFFKILPEPYFCEGWVSLFNARYISGMIRNLFQESLKGRFYKREELLGAATAGNILSHYRYS